MKSTLIETWWGVPSLFRKILILLVLSLLGALLNGALNPKRPAWYLVAGEFERTEQEIQVEWGAQVQWIDARSEELYAKGHREGAIHMSPENMEEVLFERFEEIASAGVPLVVYCDSKACQASKKVAEYLRESLPLLPVYSLFHS